MNGKITDTYLPAELFFEVDRNLSRHGGPMSAGLIPADVVEDQFGLRLAATPIDHCIRNLTHRFPDHPTYFAISQANILNAVIGRFPTFQCIIVTWEFYQRASKLWNSLLADPELVAFIRNGADPQEPEVDPVKNRTDAISSLINNEVPNNEVFVLATQLNYLLMYMVTAHEVGHLALGHLHTNRAAFLDETNPAPSDCNLSSRAREWDADGFALGATLYLTGSAFAQEPVVRGLLVSKETNMRVLTVVAYALFIIMDEAVPQARPAEQRSHPRPLVRAGLALMTIARVLHILGSMGADEALEIGRRAFRSVEIAILKLAGGVMETQLASELTEELEAEITRLSASLNDQFPKLDRTRIAYYAWSAPFLQAPPLFTPSDD